MLLFWDTYYYELFHYNKNSAANKIILLLQVCNMNVNFMEIKMSRLGMRFGVTVLFSFCII